MKRRREKEESEIRSVIEELSMMVLLGIKPVDNNINNDGDASSSSSSHDIPIKPFLSVCNLLLQVLDKIGPTMAVLTKDIHQNIQRLKSYHESSSHVNSSNLIEILKKEKLEGIARKSNSCSRACVWLTRSMAFAVALIQKLAKEPGMSMEQAVKESYSVTLKPWHGWISSAAYKVALKIVPDNKTFMALLMPEDENYDTIQEDLKTFVSLLEPLLQEIFDILTLYGLDNVKST